MDHFRLFSLPEELQATIVEHCDLDVLFNLCLANKELYEKAHKALWESIDFLRLDEFIDHYDDSDAERQRRFLMTCDILRLEHPERWRYLAAIPKSLQFSRLPGIKIAHRGKEEINDFNDFGTFVDYREGDTNVYDIIADLRNLTTLMMYVKDDWDFVPKQHSYDALANSGIRLKTLKIGGEMPTRLLYCLLSRPETIESFSCINLIHSPGQDYGPHGVQFLGSIQDQFSSLRSLHLSKLAELHEDEKVAGLRWEADADDERAVLEQWAVFLQNVSPTLVDLTLENCYNIGEGVFREVSDEGIRLMFDQLSEEGGADAATYGTRSSDRCREVLLPVLEGCEWLLLQRLVLVGMYTVTPVRFARPEIEVRYLPGNFARFNDDATPISLSPPNGLFQDAADLVGN